jgi:hypothetical protein
MDFEDLQHNCIPSKENGITLVMVTSPSDYKMPERQGMLN